MTQLILKWIVVLLALFAVGPFAASIVAPLRLPDGSHAASLLTDGSIIHGLTAGAIVLALAATMGLVAGRLIARDMGLTVAGLIVAWAAWRFSTVDRAISRIGNGDFLTTLAIEGLILGLLGTTIAVAIGLTSREKQPKAAVVGAFLEDQSPGAPIPITNLVLAGAVGAVVAAAAVWIVAVEALKGQSVMAAVIGGIACGAGAQLAATMHRIRLGILVPTLAMAVLATLSPLITISKLGVHATATATEGNLFALGRLGPLDWLAGALLGVPVGLAWANSMLEKEPASAIA